MKKCSIFVLMSAIVIACGDDGSQSVYAGFAATRQSPSILEIGVLYHNTIDDESTQYYKFTTTSTSSLQIRLTNATSDMSWTLYSDSTFTTDWVDCDNYNDNHDEICSTPTAVPAGTTLTLEVDEWDGEGSDYKLEIRKK